MIVFRIWILIGSGFKWISGSGSKQAKIVPPKRKKFHVWRVLCWPAGFSSWSLNAHDVFFFKKFFAFKHFFAWIRILNRLDLKWVNPDPKRILNTLSWSVTINGTRNGIKLVWEYVHVQYLRLAWFRAIHSLLSRLFYTTLPFRTGKKSNLLKDFLVAFTVCIILYLL